MDVKASVAEENSPPTDASAAEQLSAELEAFCAAFDDGRLGLWSWDLRSHCLIWSTDLKDFHGYREHSPHGTCLLAPDQIRCAERPGLLAVLRESLQTLEPQRIEHRLPGTSGLDERWLEATVTVTIENGAPAHMLGMCREVTERLRINREVRVRARQQETLARLGERALTEGDPQKFLNEVVTTVGKMLDAELVKILELIPGDAELLLRAGVGWQPGLVGTANVSTGRDSQAGYALASGRPVVTEDLNSETRFGGEPLLRSHGVVSGITTPIAGRDGRAYGVLGAHSTKRRKFHDYDVSFLEAVANVVAGGIQRQQLDQRHELMIRELRHRSGNLFSQLLALFSQTAKNSRSVPDLVAKYEARVMALANAHRLVTEGGWKSASLNELLKTLLAPFIDRITFGGPDVFLEPDATFALSMAVHELLTNAGKHGSLTALGGRVELTWSVARTQQGPTLLLDWKERGGPAPRRSRHPGFGSRLINMVIERQLNGQVQQSFAAEGLAARLAVPLTHERWPGAARAASPIGSPE